MPARTPSPARTIVGVALHGLARLARCSLILPLAVLQGSGPGGQAHTALTAAMGLPAAVRTGAPVVPHGIRDICYFPTHAGWTYMWEHWDPRPINTDFARIAALGANTVRVNLPPAAIGYPHPSAVMMQHLAAIASLAAAHKLRLDLELFEWFTTYADITGSVTWAKEVLAPYANDPRIAFIVLQNEMHMNDPAQVAWARSLVPVIKAAAGKVPLTISVTEYRTQPLLNNLRLLRADFPPGSGLSFLDYHFYFGGHSELAYADIKQARAIAAPYALFIGEVGFSTDPQSKAPDGVPTTPAFLEAYQEYFLRTLEHVTSALGLPAAAPWTLSDLAPGAIPSVSSASRGTREYHLGLFRVNGTPKPIALSLSSLFHGKPQNLAFNNGFEASAPVTTTAHAPLFPLYWRLLNQDRMQIATDTTTAHSGKASLEISHSAASPAYPTGAFIFPINGEAALGQRFSASVWVKGQNVTGSNGIMLTWVDSTHEPTGAPAMSPAPTGAFGWRRLTVTGTAPAGAVAVSITLASAQNTGRVWFDDVSFTRLST